jgi:hypothetical protein
MNVYFTVDTESSMAGAWSDRSRRPLPAARHIFCRVGDRDYGIGLITDMLSQYGFRGTYFVETLMTLVNGRDDVEPVFEFLLERNQDVQLHIHPTYRFYAESLEAMAAGRAYEPPSRNDLLSNFDEHWQMDLIGQASALFEQFAGRRPTAFRAGCFAANAITLRCLRRAGLLLDSSSNPCYPEWSFPGENLTPNQVRNIEGVWEIPVTVARTPLPEGYGGLKHADPCALSFAELQLMLERGAALGQQHFVIVFHSFSAVKTKDATYGQMKPDRITIGRLKRLMAYLHDRADLYRVSTFGDLARELTSLEVSQSPLAELSFVSAGVRKSVQGLNRCYWF